MIYMLHDTFDMILFDDTLTCRINIRNEINSIWNTKQLVVLRIDPQITYQLNQP